MIAESKPTDSLLTNQDQRLVGNWALYSEYIGKLLDCRPQYYERHGMSRQHHAVLVPGDLLKQDGATVPGDRNSPLPHPAINQLVIHFDCRPSRLPQQVVRLMTTRGLIDDAAGSVLFAYQPRWPLRRILVILRLDDTDQIALSWVKRLATPVWTAVSLLAVTPSLPRLYQRSNSAVTSVQSLIDMQSESGRRLQAYAEDLRRSCLRGDVRWRTGSPADQIRKEVQPAGYDLIVLADELRGRGHRWLMGELVGPLLRWADRPVLVAK